jgi:hypothetical protein
MQKKKPPFAGLSRTALAGAISLFLAAPAFSETYVVAGTRYEIIGRSKQSTIERILGVEEGRKFSSKQDLENFVKAQKQKLENLRVFKKTEVDVLYPAAEPSLPDEIPVSIKVLIVDGTPVSPIPYAFFNSNDGFQSGLLISMPNVAGSMQNLTFVGLYSAPPDENDRLRWGNPNYMMLCTWNGIRLGMFKLSLTASGAKMKNDVDDRGWTGLTYEETRLSGGAAITLPLTAHLSETLGLRFSGSPESSIVSVADPELLSYGPQERAIKASDGIAYENVNWTGNFRNGWKAGATVTVNSVTPRYADSYSDLTVDGEIAAFRTFGDRFNPGMRISAFAKTGKPELAAGRPARGIRNSTIKGTSGVFVNSGLQTKLFRIGSAELHLTPTLDFGYAYAPDAEDYQADYGFGTGGELMLIFDSMKTLPIKLGMAYDLRPSSRVEQSNRLEVDFSFNFSY